MLYLGGFPRMQGFFCTEPNSERQVGLDRYGRRGRPLPPLISLGGGYCVLPQFSNPRPSLTAASSDLPDELKENTSCHTLMDIAEMISSRSE